MLLHQNDVAVDGELEKVIIAIDSMMLGLHASSGNESFIGKIHNAYCTS